MITEMEVRELEAFLRRKDGIHRYRVVVLSGDKAEVEVEAGSADAAQAIVEVAMEADACFADDHFVEADTWWSVEELPPS